MKDALDRLKALFGLADENIDGPDKKTMMDHIRIGIENMKKWYNKQPGMIKAGLTIAAALILVLGAYLSGYYTVIKMILGKELSWGQATSMPFMRYIMFGLLTLRGLPVTLFFYILGFGIMVIAIVTRSPDLDFIDVVDEAGTIHSNKGTYGTAKFMTKEEAKQVYSVAPIEDQTGYVLAQFGYKGEETVANPTTAPGNQNYLCIASPGRGKTFGFAFTNVLQCLVRGESCCVVDPKGELCEKLYNLFVEHGYVAKVYNIVNPSRSNAWNFTNEIYDVKTGKMDYARLTAFVDIVMTNTMDGEKEDGFWGPGERNLFQAAVAYLGWKHEMTLAANYLRAAHQWKHQRTPLLSDEDKQKTLDILFDKKSCLVDKEEALKVIMRGSGIVTEDEIRQYIQDIKDASDPITIDRVFGLFVKNDLSSLMEQFDSAKIPTSHPASIAWSMFKHSDAKIQPNFILGLSQRLKLFANPDINSMSAHDDICFRKMGEEKTIIFCIISDKDSSRKLLSSLFFSFLFKDLSDAYDEAGTKNNRIPVNVMFDEFANIGKVPDFDRFIATVRSRKIYIGIIIQSVAQLAKVYDDNTCETIIECCDTILFLGCNGEETAQFISNLSGTATIIAKSIRDQKNVMGMRGLGDGYADSIGQGKRNLVMPDEARRLDTEDVLVYHAGQQMLKAHRCGYILHPLYKQGFPDPMPMSHYPTTEETYGPYISIFEEVSDVDLKNQKMWNIVNRRIVNDEQAREQGIDLDEVTPTGKKKPSAVLPREKAEPRRGKEYAEERVKRTEQSTLSKESQKQKKPERQRSKAEAHAGKQGTNLRSNLKSHM